MCSSKAPEPPPLPPPPPNFQDDFAATSANVERDRQKSLFAGLASTIRGSASGVLKSPTNTTGRAK